MSRDSKMREKLEKEVRELRMSLDARQVELRNRAAEAQSAENVLKDYEQQIRDLHVRLYLTPWPVLSSFTAVTAKVMHCLRCLRMLRNLPISHQLPIATPELAGRFTLQTWVMHAPSSMRRACAGHA